MRVECPEFLLEAPYLVFELLAMGLRVPKLRHRLTQLVDLIRPAILVPNLALFGARSALERAVAFLQRFGQLTPHLGKLRAASTIRWRQLP